MGASNLKQGSSSNNQKVNQIFQVHSNKGQMSKDNFHHFLAVSTQRVLNKVAWTYFGDRMFQSLKTSSKPVVSQADFQTYLNVLLRKDKQQLIHYSFLMYDISKKNKISRRYFCDFMQGIWLSTAGIVGKTLKKNDKLINQWAQKQKGKLRKEAQRIFQETNHQSMQGLDRQQFRLWILKGQVKRITIQYEGIVGMLPLHLSSLAQL